MGTRTTPAGRRVAALIATLATLWLALCGLPAPALAAEAILSFDSRIALQPDGDLIVTETIRVRAEGAQIRRGIFRDFPTVRREPSGLVELHGFDVLSVTRDGAPEPWHTEAITGGTRVYMGQAETMLALGPHTYVLMYRTSGQVRHLADADEVYWNVTGNYWQFPINQASATIVLPRVADILREAFYTGAPGARGQDARVTTRGPDRISFATTRALAQGEGLTVAAAFPKGLVPDPGATARTLDRIKDNLEFYALLGAVPLVGLYLTIAWLRVGRDPPKGVVIPLFEPPAGLAPAAAAWVWSRGAQRQLRGVSRGLIAALMSLGVKGRIQMVERGGDLVITRAPAQPATSPGLARHEQVLEQALLGPRTSFTVSKANANAVRGVLMDFERALHQEVRGRYYRFNHGRIALGVLASLAAVGLFYWLFPVAPAQLAAFFAGLAVAVVGGGLAVGGVRRIVGDLPGGSPRVGWLMAVPGLALLGLFALLLLVPESMAGVRGVLNLLPFNVDQVVADTLALPANRAIAGAILLLTLLNMVMGALLFAPTPEGQRTAEALAGFRLYLSVAEAERLNMRGRPDFSTSLFERYLPYAIALGVEKPWAAALESHLARARARTGHGEEPDYVPHYWSGKDFNTARIGASTAAIASTLAASFASAMPSESSSGSSGGGSSGGGGGGGGGGGW